MYIENKLRTHWDSLDADELRARQGHRLRHFLKNHVVPFSSHYSRLFEKAGIDPDCIRTVENLEQLPFSSKRSLISETDGTPMTRDFVLVPDEKVISKRPSTIIRAMSHGKSAVKAGFEREYRPILMTSTTGRSAEPIPFLYSQHDLDNLALTGRRLMEVCDSRPDFRHFNLFPFAPHLAFWQAHYAGLGYNTFTLSTGGGKVMGTEGNVRLLDKINPDALIGMPTFIYHVLQVAVEKGLHCPNIRRIVLGGEKVPEGLRRKLRALCAELGSGKVEVMATYGFTEAKMAFPECPSNGGEATGYHLYPDLGIVEVIDPDTGEVVPDGEPGEVVFTPLDSRGSVVLRYRTGDLISGGITHEECPACGGKMPRLLGHISRVSDVRRMNIGKVKGTLVNFNELEHVLDDLAEVGTWQIELRKRNDDPLESDEIVVHVAPTSRREREEIESCISERFAAATEIRPNRIEFHDAADLRRRHGVGTALKEEKVIDRRDEAKAVEGKTLTPVSHHEKY
ncbi:MAG: AMP-binding protein [Verrucomicrobiota bacterium]